MSHFPVMHEALLWDGFGTRVKAFSVQASGESSEALRQTGSASNLEVALTVAVIVSTVFTLVLLLLPSQYQPRNRPAGTVSAPALSVQVLVLGDIGRSPRMQYHALSLAEHGLEVQLIGYRDSEPLPALLTHPNVKIVPLADPPRAWQTSNRSLFLLLAPLKVLFQIWTLWSALSSRTKATKWMLVQNPPSIPTLAIATLVCFLRSTRLVIDWHNFGYSILALKLGASHPLVAVSNAYEKAFARYAFAHLTVTKAMGDVLRKRGAMKGTILTLHDRPAAQFQPFDESRREVFLTSQPATTAHANAIISSKKRLLVSSTSWTPDEDFSILLDALCRYSAQATSTHPQLPEILVVITGKGPQRELYMSKITQVKRTTDKLEMVEIISVWLSFTDYASLLASADLGVSLHTSSSGVDLPMKVVDMFGAGLPVTGCTFHAWPELVTEDVNGKGFKTSAQLADILVSLFEPGNNELARLKRGALAQSSRRWDGEWNEVAAPLFGLSEMPSKLTRP